MEKIYGDINKDGKLTIEDTADLLDVLQGLSEGDEFSIQDLSDLQNYFGSANGISICVDQGHGKGSNKSPNYPVYVEGDRMYTLGRYLAGELFKKGYRVVLTRGKPEDNPSLRERGEIAGKYKCDLMLSLHSNAPSASPDGTYDPSITGVCACYSQKDKNFNRPLAQKLAKKVGEIMENGVKAVFYNSYLGKPGTDYFGVLRYSAAYGCPHAIIIEHGYHTCPKDAEFLMYDENLKEIAKEEANIIDAYLQQKRIFYRVQVGAYFMQKNAQNQLEKVQRVYSSDAFIAKSGLIYRVQVGAYWNRENAENVMKDLRNLGFSDAYIVEVKVENK